MTYVVKVIRQQSKVWEKGSRIRHIKKKKHREKIVGKIQSLQGDKEHYQNGPHDLNLQIFLMP